MNNSNKIRNDAFEIRLDGYVAFKFNVLMKKATEASRYTRQIDQN